MTTKRQRKVFSQWVMYQLAIRFLSGKSKKDVKMFDEFIRYVDVHSQDKDIPKCPNNRHWYKPLK